MYQLFLFSLLSIFVTRDESITNRIPQPTFKVIAIADGDSFSVLNGKTEIRIRLEGIDAPEKGMPYYKVSKQYLAQLCFNKYIILKAVKTDRYGRTVARASLANGKDISIEMVKNGLAWHYKKYSSNRTLANLEVQARKHKIGLWKDRIPIPPWEVRKLRRNGNSTKEIFKNRVE